MLNVYRASNYRKAFIKLTKSGSFSNKDREKLEAIIITIKKEQKLDPRYKDHELSGEFNGIRECHIKPDLLLLYKIEQDILTLVLLNLGSHSELFD